MCGICGKLIFKDDIPAPGSIQAMCNTIIHRGPDDEGIYTAPHIGLGQRRLSIIDLAADACPPLSNEEGTVWLVFNGEIYNFQELRQKLQAKGHCFTTHTDTEVIIHLYEEDGVACLQKLRGMFAFALWDERRKVLFCARDRLGKKPFCYTKTAQSFIFGSEIKAITADPDVSIAPDYHAIDQYLTYQFVPSPLTAFTGIKRLRPGEYLLCDVKGNVTTQRYWQPTLVQKSTASPQEIEEELLQRLREAVRLRMIADVPLGAFLSGGIDSATIVALMAQESNHPVKTFSIGFEEEAFNELPYARLVAERYSTEHHELIVKPNAAEVLPLLVHHYNEPFADSSALPTYYVSQMTRQHVTVALSGDGGDETFAGYTNYATVLDWNKWDVWPLRLRQLLAESGRGLLYAFPHSNRAARLRRGLAMFGAADVKARRLQFGTILKPEEKRLAYTATFREQISHAPIPQDLLAAYAWQEGMDALDWLMCHDQNFYLPDCLMVKSDIAAMANSLEVRCPFLDHEFVEFAATIPSQFKRNGSGGKLILKQAVKDLLPTELFNKPKSGFSLPVASWFRGEMAPLLKETLLSSTAEHRKLFDPRLVKKMVDEHVEGRRDWSNRLWAFLFLELWFREFID
jgi:asparagine synthase (glutamine-hydrolysing)